MEVIKLKIVLEVTDDAQIIDWSQYHNELASISNKFIGLSGENGIPSAIIVSDTASDIEIESLKSRLSSVLR